MSGGTLEASVVANDIQAIECRLDISSPLWCMDDFNVWPIYRMNLYRAFCVNDASSMAGRLRTIGQSMKTAIAHGPGQRFVEKDGHDIWLVSDGISFMALDDSGYEVERLCTPLVATLSEGSGRPVIIDREGAAFRRCRNPMRWLTPLTQRAKIRAAISAKLCPDRRHEARFVELARVAKEMGVELPKIGPRQMDVKCRAVGLLADRLEWQMRQERLKAVFVGCYYNVSGFAYLLASSRCGIPSVDIQHGVTGRYHVGYAGWNQVSPEISRLLPKWFWAWTEADAAVVTQWADRSGGGHRAIVGGNPYVEAWKSGEFSAGGQVERSCRELVADAGVRQRVLVTFQQGFLSDAAIAPLLDWWSSHPDVAWWCRLHPMSWSDKPRVAALLRKHQVGHWDIERASSLPLLSLLGAVQLHVTHSSSAVIEAEQMGVPSLVWSRYGEELFADNIRLGTVRSAGGGGDLQVFTFPRSAVSGSGDAGGGLRESAMRRILGERS